MLAIGFGTVVLWLGIALGVAVALFIAQLLWFSGVMAWEEKSTAGGAYYALPPAERAAYKRKLRRQSLLVFPTLRLLGAMSKSTLENGTFVHDGVAGPKGTCSADSYAKARAYPAGAGDVFVATQMKCGTTWMQHVVYQVLHRGAGDLVERGQTLYGVSPWLEGRKTLPAEQAPRHGAERPMRVFKTHLPASLCPWSPDAKYVYVVRHPVSCFASCVDFLRTNLGAFTPPLPEIERWFCSDKMWWGPWPQHVAGWWERAQGSDNVLFVTFEDMKRDLAGVVDRVAALLGVSPLTDAERDEVVRKCGFAYMQEHQDAFEMNPPHLLQTEAALFVRGSANRHEDVPEDVRQRVGTWCRDRVADGPLPLAELYPDVAR